MGVNSDSYLYIFNSNKAELLNIKQYEFLNVDSLDNIENIVNYGVKALSKDSLIVLTSDGLTQAMNKNLLLDESDLIELIEHNNPHSTIKNFIHTAFDLGGTENVSIAVFRSNN